MAADLVAHWRKTKARSTAHTYRSKLQQLLGVLAQFGAPIIKAPHTPTPLQRGVVFKGEELQRLLAEPQPFLRLYILLYLQCGLRSAEALAVSPRSWDPEQHTVTIKVKGGRIRTAAVTPDVEILFASASADSTDERGFISLLRGRPISARGMEACWWAHRQKCGISNLVTAHDLRRTAATILYTATKDLRVPQQLLGHRRLESTLKYLAPLAPEEARRYQDLLRFDKFHTEVKQ